MLSLTSPRHISTLPIRNVESVAANVRNPRQPCEASIDRCSVVVSYYRKLADET
jgi:hypothetical protein